MEQTARFFKFPANPARPRALLTFPFLASRESNPYNSTRQEGRIFACDSIGTETPGYGVTGVGCSTDTYWY